MDSATIINLVIQLVAGAAGGNGLAKAAHSLNLGTTGNTIAGAIGGLAGGTWLGPAIAAMAGGAASGMNVGAIVGDVVGGA
ncbi:hypothetical protein [Bordetella parapertussis]|uniref:hypothetical protein n=1 Tax=Bordetella parapertussis TaxID=519 RepID=UPI001E47E0D4|nr:hypothetical protein [Bordetella parapertussis]